MCETDLARNGQRARASRRWLGSLVAPASVETAGISHDGDESVAEDEEQSWSKLVDPVLLPRESSSAWL